MCAGVDHTEIIIFLEFETKSALFNDNKISMRLQNNDNMLDLLDAKQCNMSRKEIRGYPIHTWLHNAIS